MLTPGATAALSDFVQKCLAKNAHGRAEGSHPVHRVVKVPAADRPAIIVEANGLRTVRLADVLLLLLGAVAFLRLLRFHGASRLIRSSTCTAAVAGALIALIAINGQSCSECLQESFARPTTLFRGLALLVSSHLLFLMYSGEQRSQGVLLFATFATVWALASTFLLIQSQWPPFPSVQRDALPS